MTDLETARLFTLERDVDVTGVSGVGTVAEGIEFSDGRVVLRWCVGEHRSTVQWDSIDAVRAIHGHDGNTRVVYGAVRADAEARIEVLFAEWYGSAMADLFMSELRDRAALADPPEQVGR